nr:signal peptidase I [Spirilliplanes yamanashiensis]
MGGYQQPTGGRRRRRSVAARRKEMPLWQELPLLLVVAFCLAVLIRTFLVQAFFIPSGSMEETLLVGDRVLVNKVVYDMRDPLRGEVVVFRGPSTWEAETPTEPLDNSFSAKFGRTIGDLVGVSRPGERDFIKRVIGLPGDRVACCDAQGRITVNDIGIDEPYIFENSDPDAPPAPGECRSRQFAEVTISPGNMWVMGDHRLVSQDSRCQGEVPIDNIIGRAFVIVWPSDRFDGLSVPPVWQEFAAQQNAASLPGDTPRSAPSPIGAVLTMPFLLTSAISARSGLTRWNRRRRLPS